MSRASDLDWARQTGGRLSRLRSASLIFDLLRLQLRRSLARRRRPLPLLPGDIDTALRLPDSAIVAAALAECRETCAPAIAAHCLRTSAWGSMIGIGRVLKFDREALVVASLLHDLELGRTGERAASACACFACASALRAEHFALRRGRDQAWARRVGDAIALHLDPVVPLSRGVEAHLLQAGAVIDVIGAGLGQVPKAARNAVLGCHPRDGLKDELVASLEREAALGERTRTALLVAAGFTRRIAAAPLA